MATITDFLTTVSNYITTIGISDMFDILIVGFLIYQLIRLDLQRRESQEKQARTAADMVGKLKQEQET